MDVGAGLRVLVCGGRDYTDQPRLFESLDSIHSLSVITTIIHGAATGADTLAGKWAATRGIDIEPFPVKKYESPLSRNHRMLEGSSPDIVVHFPGGSGTRDMVHRARIAGITTIGGLDYGRFQGDLLCETDCR